MRFQLFLWVVLIFGVGNAFAIKPATQAEIAAIEAQIAFAKGMDKEIRAAVKKYDEAVETVESTDSVLSELERAVERAKAKQLAARTKAIHMTILAWDLAPSNLHGTSVMRRTNGRTISWMPLAGEGEDREIENAKGKFNPAGKPKEDFAGVTYSDGVTFIPKSTFDLGVGYLAAVLFHERTHFDQYTNEDKRGMSSAQREEEAYQAGVDNTGIFFDSIKDKDKIKHFQDKLRENKDKVKKEKSILGVIGRIVLPADQGNMAESMAHTNEELADISGLVAQARSQADIARVEREKREARDREAAEVEAQREQDRRLRDLYLDIGRRSCSDPGSVSQDELDNLPDPHGADFKDVYPQGVGDCVVGVFFRLHKGMNANDLREVAAPVVAVDVRAQPPDVRAVTPQAVRSFRATLYGLKNFAVAACRSTEPVPVEEEIVHPNSPLDFNRNSDDLTANYLAEGLGTCESLLFRRMIELIRAGQSRIITGRWAQEAAAGYRTPEPPSYVTPSAPVRGKRCEDYGNKYCPK